MVPPQSSGSDSPSDKKSNRTLHLMNQSVASKKEKKVLIVEREEIHSTGSLTWTGLDGESESSSCRIRTEVEPALKDVSKHFYQIGGGQGRELTYRKCADLLII
jgi:hypothetical protein